MEDTLIFLFFLVDDFCQVFLPEWNKHLVRHRLKKRHREGQLSPSEIMSIYIHFINPIIGISKIIIFMK